VSEAVTIEPGSHRWTAWHDEWEEDVASAALETQDGLVVIDPIDPPRQLAHPTHVLITVFWHRPTDESLDTAATLLGRC
jgi:hypothetical protein